MKKEELIEDVKQYTDEELRKLLELLRTCLYESWHVDDNGLFVSTKLHTWIRRFTHAVVDELDDRGLC